MKVQIQRDGKSVDKSFSVLSFCVLFSFLNVPGQMRVSGQRGGGCSYIVPSFIVFFDDAL